MISLQQMQYMVILSEELKFSKASERCFVTQPTLSMQVKKAEDLLGYPVFDRTTNPLSLTPYGKEIIPVLREILNENDKLKLINDRMAGRIKEEIRVGIIPTVSVYLLPIMFQRFSAILPQSRLVYHEYQTEDLLSELERGNLDLAILAGPYHQAKWRTIPVFKEEMHVYTPQGNNSQISVTDLESLHPWLLSKGNCLRTQVMNFCNITRDSAESSWDYFGGNLDLLVEMVNSNGGYTILPSRYKSSKEKKGYRKQLMSPYGFPAREIRLCKTKKGS